MRLIRKMTISLGAVALTAGMLGVTLIEAGAHHPAGVTLIEAGAHHSAGVTLIEA
jgi:hypothetical protein